jgi:antitoxin component of MazEF toxin-antitoxin module
MARFRELVSLSITVMVLATTIVLLSPHRVRAFESARELAAQCKSVQPFNIASGTDALIPGTKGALQCWGYLQAMQDLSVLVDENGKRLMGACPNERTTLMQLSRAFVAYADRHSNESDNDAALIVMDALRESFPCP